MDQERVRTCLALLLGELKFADKELPYIVVLHADRKLADAAGAKETSIRRNAPRSPAGSAY